MADNSTHPIVEILESFGLSKIFYHIYTLYKEFSLAYIQINSQCYKVNFVLNNLESVENAVSSLLRNRNANCSN